MNARPPSCNGVIAPTAHVNTFLTASLGSPPPAALRELTPLRKSLPQTPQGTMRHVKALITPRTRCIDAAPTGSRSLPETPRLASASQQVAWGMRTPLPTFRSDKSFRGGAAGEDATEVEGAATDAEARTVRLQLAVSSAAAGDRLAVQAFLNGGGDPDASASGMSLLGAAAARGRVRVVELLIDRGASIDAYAGDDGARTALMHACLGRQPLVVRQLLSANAQLHQRSATGATALQLLREMSRHEVLDALEFTLLLDCTRAFTERVQRDELEHLEKLVPPPETNTTAEDDRQLELWQLRVLRERERMETLSAENAKRAHGDLNAQVCEARFFHAAGEARGDNAGTSVAKKLVRQRTSLRAGNSIMQVKPVDGLGMALSVARKASKLLRPLDYQPPG